MAMYVIHAQDLFRAFGECTAICDVRPIDAREVAALLGSGQAGFVSSEAVAQDLAKILGISLRCDAFPLQVSVGDEWMIVSAPGAMAECLQCLSMEVMVLHAGPRTPRSPEGV